MLSGFAGLAALKCVLHYALTSSDIRPLKHVYHEIGAAKSSIKVVLVKTCMKSEYALFPKTEDKFQHLSFLQRLSLAMSSLK